VFIFARARDGPPAPLAVLRKRVADLPVKFTLDDSMAMAPGMNLSRFGTVIVGARISKSGNAVRQPGDVEGYSKAVSTGTTGIEIIIDTEVR
jgi:cytochrome c-type biogenesis protein CcmH